jgi:hypothetical protein
VPRFSLISTVHTNQDLHINNAFVRRLALESVRLGADTSLIMMLGEREFSVRERYAPMHRLLAQDDELLLIRQGFPALGKQLRREHRSCYFGYVKRLTQEIRAARRLGALAMASKENWSFWMLLAQAALSESSLLYLRWLGCRHAAGINVAARDVGECLDFLLAGPRFHLATT